MSTIIITSVAELAHARNALRAQILAQDWPPVLCVRAVGALTTLGELILKLHITGNLETAIRPERKGVEIKGVFPKNAAEEFALVRKQLDRAVDTIEVQDKDNQLHIDIFVRAEI